MEFCASPNAPMVSLAEEALIYINMMQILYLISTWLNSHLISNETSLYLPYIFQDCPETSITA